MNALLKLSRRYHSEELSLTEYRSLRRKVIYDIMNDSVTEQFAITNVPQNDDMDITLQSHERERNIDDVTLPTAAIKSQTTHKVSNQRDAKTAIKEKNSRKNNSSFMIVGAVLAIAAGLIAYQMTTQSENETPAANTASEQVTAIEQNTVLVTNMLADWRSILANNNFTDAHRDSLQQLWLAASEEEKQQYLAYLNEYVNEWRNDFDHEIQVGLTNQVIVYLNSL